MKKIGIVTTWFERGAAYVSRQFKEVWETENEVFIYVRGGEDIAKDESLWNKGNITYGKRYDYSNLDFIDLKHFEKWIVSNHLDFVFFNEQHLWKPVLLCHHLRIKTGAYIDYYTSETVPFFRLYDFLICNTKRHYSVFDWHPNVYYIPWGTTTKVFNKGHQKKTHKKELTFFHSSGMNPYRKGTDYVLKAFNDLNSKSAKLIIHTQVKLSDFFPELKSLIKELKESKRLKIIHKTVPAPGLYALGDVYVYPTRLEGIGLTIAEASACGMPVITTNEAPMNEFVKHGINGKLVNVKTQKPRKDQYYWPESEIDLTDLTKQMQYFLDHHDSLDQFKKKSYSFAYENLNWEKNAIYLLDILKKISLISFENKAEVYIQVKNFEDSRGVWFYVANTKLYRRIKSRLVYIFKKIAL